MNTVPRSSARLHLQILHAVMRAPYSFFVNTDSGVTLNRFSSDMALIEGELVGGLMMFLSGLTQCLGSAALIAAGASYVGAAIPVSQTPSQLLEDAATSKQVPKG